MPNGTPTTRRVDYFSKRMDVVVLLKLSQQSNIELHAHEFSELVIITGGHGNHFTETGKFPVSTGDVFVIDPGLAHGYRDTHNLSLINILFNFDRLSIPLVDLAESPGFHALFRLEPHYRHEHAFESRLKLDSKQLKEVSPLLARMYQHKQSVQPGHDFIQLSLFMQLVGILSQGYGEMVSAPSRRLMDAGAVFSHIERHFDRAITTAELCRIAHLSESSLLRMFHETVGTSPHDYLLTIRINHARNLLATSPDKITTIAFQTGFSDSNYFARQFKKRTGLSPAAYRARNSSKA
ncbi:MAG: helix-turn-helix domain-containing protein [bacterium]